MYVYKCIKRRIFQTFYYSTNDIIIISSSGNYLPPYICDGKNEHTETQVQVQQSRASQPAEAEAKRANSTSNTKDV